MKLSVLNIYAFMTKVYCIYIPMHSQIDFNVQVHQVQQILCDEPYSYIHLIRITENNIVIDTFEEQLIFI